MSQCVSQMASGTQSGLAPGKLLMEPCSLRNSLSSSIANPFGLVTAHPILRCNDFAAVFLGKEFRGVIADVSESLKCDSLSFESFRQS